MLKIRYSVIVNEHLLDIKLQLNVVYSLLDDSCLQFFLKKKTNKSLKYLEYIKKVFYICSVIVM